MGYNKKTWKDRITEFPNRRLLREESSGTENYYAVTRAEGAITQEGDVFSADNMNDFEQRIYTALAGKSISIMSEDEYFAIPVAQRDNSILYLTYKTT